MAFRILNKTKLQQRRVIIVNYHIIMHNKMVLSRIFLLKAVDLCKNSTFQSSHRAFLSTEILQFLSISVLLRVWDVSEDATFALLLLTKLYSPALFMALVTLAIKWMWEQFRLMCKRWLFSSRTNKSYP